MASTQYPRKSRGAGKTGTVQRISALIADLDFSRGKCGDIDTANAIIADLSEILGAHPAAITHSGGGLHPYWAISNGYSVLYGLAALLQRWRRLVEMVAKTHGAHVDNVFDLARVLPVPETFNNKAATNGESAAEGGHGHEPIPVVCHRGSGVALTLADVDKRLCAYGIREISDFPEESEFKSDPDTWVFADATCAYVAGMIDGWADDAQPDGLELGKAATCGFEPNGSARLCAEA